MTRLLCIDYWAGEYFTLLEHLGGQCNTIIDKYVNNITKNNMKCWEWISKRIIQMIANIAVKLIMCLVLRRKWSKHHYLLYASFKKYHEQWQHFNLFFFQSFGKYKNVICLLFADYLKEFPKPKYIENSSKIVFPNSWKTIYWFHFHWPQICEKGMKVSKSKKKKNTRRRNDLVANEATRFITSNHSNDAKTPINERGEQNCFQPFNLSI